MNRMDDLISRQAAIDAAIEAVDDWDGGYNITRADMIADAINNIVPSAQPERDIPKKPTETTDMTWSIPHRQAVCPNCDCYLGAALFIGADKKRKVTYCEYCGQAIDWEGWESDETD